MNLLLNYPFMILFLHLEHVLHFVAFNI